MTTPRRAAFVLAALTTCALAVMIAINLATGATQEGHEWFVAPADYAAGLLAGPQALRALMGVDVAFIVLYTAFFVALRAYLRARGGAGAMFASFALGAIALAALLDAVENHHILAALDMAEHGQLASPDSIALQQVISQTKFTAAYLGLTLFGLALPRDTKLGWALSLFLSAGVLVTGVLGIAAPPAWRPLLDQGRWYGFFVGFALAAWWLRSAPEPDGADAHVHVHA